MLVICRFAHNLRYGVFRFTKDQIDEQMVKAVLIQSGIKVKTVQDMEIHKQYERMFSYSFEGPGKETSIAMFSCREADFDLNLNNVYELIDEQSSNDT